MDISSVYRLIYRTKWYVHLRLAKFPNLPIISGRAIVVGSAPTAVFPHELIKGSTIFCVNGSQVAMCKATGILKPDFTLIRKGGDLKNNLEADKQLARVLSDQQTSCLIVTGSARKNRVGPARLREIGFMFDELIKISGIQMDKIQFKVLGWPRSVSRGIRSEYTNGLRLVALALEMGASEVVVTGISLSTSGHNYTTVQTPRPHIVEDHVAFLSMVRKRLPVLTTDPILAKQTGLCLWSPDEVTVGAKGLV